MIVPDLEPKCEVDTDSQAECTEVPSQPVNKYYEKLTKQVLKAGGELGKIQQHTFEDDLRGMIATGDIEKDELICFIPREMLITFEEAQESKLYKAVNDAGIDMKSLQVNEDTMPLALFVLEESKKSKSKWGNYIKTWPKDWSSFPILYTDEEV